MTLFEGLPSSLRIGPFDVKIEICHLGGEDEDSWGIYHHAEQRIQLNDFHPSLSFAADTLMHEINHALWRISDLGKRANEERVAQTFATGWIQIYRDNPKLIQWIQTACQ